MNSASVAAALDESRAIAEGICSVFQQYSLVVSRIEWQLQREERQHEKALQTFRRQQEEYEARERQLEEEEKRALGVERRIDALLEFARRARAEDALAPVGSASASKPKTRTATAAESKNESRSTSIARSDKQPLRLARKQPQPPVFESQMRSLHSRVAKATHGLSVVLAEFDRTMEEARGALFLPGGGEPAVQEPAEGLSDRCSAAKNEILARVARRRRASAAAEAIRNPAGERFLQSLFADVGSVCGGKTIARQVIVFQDPAELCELLSLRLLQEEHRCLVPIEKMLMKELWEGQLQPMAARGASSLSEEEKSILAHAFRTLHGLLLRRGKVFGTFVETSRYDAFQSTSIVRKKAAAAVAVAASSSSSPSVVGQ